MSAPSRTTPTQPGTVIGYRTDSRGRRLEIVVESSRCADEVLEDQLNARIDAGYGRGYSAGAMETNALYGGVQRRR